MIVRVLAIAAGIASAALMAVDSFKVPLDQAFVEVLEGIRELIGTVLWPFERVIVLPIVNWMNDQGFVVELYPHWKSSFVLLWLLFSSAARRAFFPAWQLIWTLWGGVCALVASVCAGTVPLDDPAVLWWPLAGFFLFAMLRVREEILYAIRSPEHAPRLEV